MTFVAPHKPSKVLADELAEIAIASFDIKIMVIAKKD